MVSSSKTMSVFCHVTANAISGVEGAVWGFEEAGLLSVFTCQEQDPEDRDPAANRNRLV